MVTKELQSVRKIPACTKCIGGWKMGRSLKAIQQADTCDTCLGYIVAPIIERLGAWMNRAHEALDLVEKQNKELRRLKARKE